MCAARFLASGEEQESNLNVLCVKCIYYLEAPLRETEKMTLNSSDSLTWHRWKKTELQTTRNKGNDEFRWWQYGTEWENAKSQHGQQIQRLLSYVYCSWGFVGSSVFILCKFPLVLTHWLNWRVLDYNQQVKYWWKHAVELYYERKIPIFNWLLNVGVVLLCSGAGLSLRFSPFIGNALMYFLKGQLSW